MVTQVELADDEVEPGAPRRVNLVIPVVLGVVVDVVLHMNFLSPLAVTACSQGGTWRLTLNRYGSNDRRSSRGLLEPDASASRRGLPVSERRVRLRDRAGDTGGVAA